MLFCDVENKIGATVYNIEVSKTYRTSSGGSGKWGATLLRELKSNKTQRSAVHASASSISSDRWKVKWMSRDGHCLGTEQGNWLISKEDLASGEPLKLILGKRDNKFVAAVQKPKSPSRGFPATPVSC